MTDSYRVLARKYRPADFSEVKGQNVLVTTITNAIKMGKVPHAFLMTGIRGVGKTTTARIIAKTLNCTNLDLSQNIVIPCSSCANCTAFQNGKHPDFIEVDAASKTGVNDIREIIDNCRYMPQISKYKVYVIDEVHMLSINAFNALLKTLEEPPSHVIFIFATTEVRKVPITILSRCQRFDLRRLTQDEIIEHMESVLLMENLTAERTALEMIAKCSEGSVRDSLSLLDQAIINNVEGKILATEVSKILGVGDKAEIVDLLEMIVDGKVDPALSLLNSLYYKGIDPVLLINELIELVNLITKMKCAGLTVQNNYILSEKEIAKLKLIAERSSIPLLTILWQMSLKAVNEMSYAANVFGAAEMFVIRTCYISDKPLPHDLLSKHDTPDLSEDKSPEISLSDKLSNIIESQITKKEELLFRDEDQTAKIKVNNFKELVQLFYSHKEMILYHHLYEDVHLVKFEPRILKIRQKGNVPHNFANQISNFLNEWTGNKWVVTLSTDQGEPSLKEVDDLQLLRQKNEIIEDKIVKEVMNQFEGSKITNIVKNELV